MLPTPSDKSPETEISQVRHERLKSCLPKKKNAEAKLREKKWWWAKMLTVRKVTVQTHNYYKPTRHPMPTPIPSPPNWTATDLQPVWRSQGGSRSSPSTSISRSGGLRSPSPPEFGGPHPRHAAKPRLFRNEQHSARSPGFA